MTGNGTKVSGKGQNREKTIERKLLTAVRVQGGIALKLACPAYAGLPDRLVLLPGGLAYWVQKMATGMSKVILGLYTQRQLRVAQKMEEERSVVNKIYWYDEVLVVLLKEEEYLEGDEPGSLVNID